MQTEGIFMFIHIWKLVKDRLHIFKIYLAENDNFNAGQYFEKKMKRLKS